MLNTYLTRICVIGVLSLCANKTIIGSRSLSSSRVFPHQRKYIEKGAIAQTRVLHFTLHKGCHHEIMWLGAQLNLDMTSINIHDMPAGWLDGKTTDHGIYTITRMVAHNACQKHRARTLIEWKKILNSLGIKV